MVILVVDDHMLKKNACMALFIDQTGLKHSFFLLSLNLSVLRNTLGQDSLCIGVPGWLSH